MDLGGFSEVTSVTGLVRAELLEGHISKCVHGHVVCGLSLDVSHVVGQDGDHVGFPDLLSVHSLPVRGVHLTVFFGPFFKRKVSQHSPD